MGIHFGRRVREPNALRQPNPDANAAAPVPIAVGAPVSRASFNFRHHAMFWVVFLSIFLLYLHIGHRVSFEPTVLYQPRLFWRSLGAEIATVIARIALWCHGILEKFEV